jgi:2-polyprenyl-3-methyl-5-hydroxy-6-metoxy-1,4-benzoquinol methylase
MSSKKMIELEERSELRNEDIRVMDRPVCMLCGSFGEPLFHDLCDRMGSALGTWSYKQCPHDGLVWLDPYPYPEEILKLYEGYSLTHTVTYPTPKRAAWLRKTIRQGILETAFGYKELGGSWVEQAIGRISSWVGPLRDAVGGMALWLDGSSKGRLLDVGCGNGENVTYLQTLGWQVSGVEPDLVAASLAREKFGLEVTVGSLEQAKFPAEYFNAITMAHVIEHLPDPVGTLIECYRVLEPGGRLIIITPNMSSLGERLFKGEWMYLDPPRHLNLFSLSNLKMLVEMVGLHVSGGRTTERNASSVWSGSRRIHQNGKISGGKLPGRQSTGGALAGFGYMALETGLSLFLKSGEELVFTVIKN